MAKRYSGNLQISVIYTDAGDYRTSVSRDGKLLWRGSVNPARSGFGPGIAYDSPKAYDEIAASALAFGNHDVDEVGDEAEHNEDMNGYLIRRTPRSGKKAKALGAHHSTVKKPSRARTYQYRAVVTGKGILIGGTKRHASAWFNTKKEADDWAWAISTGNRPGSVAFVTIERRHDGIVELVKWAHAGEVEI